MNLFLYPPAYCPVGNTAGQSRYWLSLNTRDFFMPEPPMDKLRPSGTCSKIKKRGVSQRDSRVKRTYGRQPIDTSYARRMRKT